MIYCFKLHFIFVVELIRSKCYRLHRRSKNFELVSEEKAVALSAVNRAVFTFFNYGDNIVVPDISTVFVILRLVGSSEEKAGAIFTVAYLENLIVNPFWKFV